MCLENCKISKKGGKKNKANFQFSQFLRVCVLINDDDDVCTFC